MWLSTPIIGMMLTYIAYHFLQKHVLQHADVKRRIVKLIPYQITFTFSVMFFAALTKNFVKAKDLRERDNMEYLYFGICIFLFPILMLPTARYYLLRRARNLEWISHGKQLAAKKIK